MGDLYLEQSDSGLVVLNCVSICAAGCDRDNVP